MHETEWRLLCSSGLFSGIGEEALKKLLHCLGAERRHFEKNELLYHMGQPVTSCALLLSGSVRAESVDPAGEHTLIALHGAGALVGDVLMATPGSVSPVYVLAAEPATVLFLPFRRIMGGCRECCPCHQRLRENLIGEIAQKYWDQRQRIGCLSLSSLRGRIVRYLLEQARGSSTFSIGITREQLADYLCVNRSALSRELSRMKQEHLIDYYRDSFRILNPEALSLWSP